MINESRSTFVMTLQRIAFCAAARHTFTHHYIFIYIYIYTSFNDNSSSDLKCELQLAKGVQEQQTTKSIESASFKSYQIIKRCNINKH